jgi:maltose O-acetyltransferase
VFLLINDGRIWMTERDKMLAGELYNPLDADLVLARERARDLCQTLNQTRESEQELRRGLLSGLFGAGGDTVWMQPPFYCDYGSNIYLGTRVFFNFNCIVLDVCAVRIGDYTLFGPSVQILTPIHPFNAALRREQESGKPVEIGADVWVGGGALILAGVHVGSRAGNRRWQCRDARYPGRCFRGRQSLSCHSGYR